MSSHDRRTTDEPWAWLVAVSDTELDRDAHRARGDVPMSLRKESVPALMRVGDLVVYFTREDGTLVGVGQVVGEPHRKTEEPGSFRVRVLPQLILDRESAPSLADAAVEAPRLSRHLEPKTYHALRELMLSAAVPLPGGAPSEPHGSP